MAGPSNIRVNPFTGTGGATNYVELTEKHVIPAVSPYVIRLNEVPEKQDPSNMKMVYVDSATGAATENTLTEVAATPGQGEFRPDYSTNALEDKTWNTGLIEFSASDAGKIVQVTYTGTGTLAGVNSNHWPSWYTDRGDGSDGDFVPTGNTTISGVKNYKSVFIKEGITITVNKNAIIKVLHSFTNLGTIKSTGASGGAGGATDNVGKAGSNGTISSGGAGGKSSSNDNRQGGAGGGHTYFSSIAMDDAVMKNICESIGFVGVGAGGGGGAGGTSGFGNGTGGVGGTGGGSICITCGEFNNKGTVSSSGYKGGNGSGGSKYGPGGGGGGGGGAVFVFANIIVSEGTVIASGGAGGSGNAGGSNGASGGNGFTKICEVGV